MLFRAHVFKTTMQCNEPYNVNRQLTRIREIKVSHPTNIMAKVFDEKYFNTLSPEKQQRLLNCCNSGIENPDSEMGCYACMPDD